jgi:predicted dithiol-disulfide oxidoreductase (DUF899 family)
LEIRRASGSARICSRAQWTIARKSLLDKEKALTKLRDQLTAERLALPWVKIEKPYTFDAPQSQVTLEQLFNGRSQLFIKHFMMGPGQEQQCVGCSLQVDHVDGILEHLENRDVSYVAVARAPIGEIKAVRKRMGWRITWVSAFHNDFNYDFHASFKPDAANTSYNFRQIKSTMEDLSGTSIFYKDERDQIFHTYSSYGRGDEEFLGIYRMLDVVPKGRDENGRYLPGWARPRNMYGKGGTVEQNGRYHAPESGCETRAQK